MTNPMIMYIFTLFHLYLVPTKWLDMEPKIHVFFLKPNLIDFERKQEEASNGSTQP